jgi:hypothetical protein
MINKILVTGSNGLVGSALKKLWVNKKIVFIIYSFYNIIK